MATTPSERSAARCSMKPPTWACFQARTDFGSVEWAPDGKSLVFNRLQAPRKGARATDKYQHSQALLLRAGAPVASAKAVFGTAVKGVSIAPAEIPIVTLSHDGKWAFGVVINGTQTASSIIVDDGTVHLRGGTADTWHEAHHQ